MKDYMERLKWKDYNNSFNNCIDKKELYKMIQYFLKPYKPLAWGINVKFDLSNYVTKTDLKEATRIDAPKLAAKYDLAGQKTELDKIDVEKLRTVYVDLSKLSNLVNNEVVKELYMIN